MIQKPPYQKECSSNDEQYHFLHKKKQNNRRIYETFSFEQIYPIKIGKNSPNTKILREICSLVVVRKFILNVLYRNGNENLGSLLTNRESRLQNRTFIYKWGVLGYKWDFRLTIHPSLSKDRKCIKNRVDVIKL